MRSARRSPIGKRDPRASSVAPRSGHYPVQIYGLSIQGILPIISARWSTLYIELDGRLESTATFLIHGNAVREKTPTPLPPRRATVQLCSSAANRAMKFPGGTQDRSMHECAC